MSERDQEQSVSESVQELSAKVATLAETVDDWGAGVAESVGKSVAAALSEAEKRGAAHQEELAGKWEKRLGGEVQRQQALTAQLNQEAHNLHTVLSWQQEVSAPGLWGVSRGTWRVVVVSVLLALGASWGGVEVYNAVGPPAKARAELEEELARYRGVWDALTEAEQAEVNKRIAGEDEEEAGG